MKVIYIMGDSRSGSTLLQKLLSMQDGVVSLGEVRRFERLVRSKKQSCACGVPVDHCSFWKQIVKEAGFADGSQVTTYTRISRSPYAQLKCAMTALAVRHGHRRVARRLLSKEHMAATQCISLVEAAGRISNARIIIDSSKTPLHFFGLWLEKKELFHPIFLIRDGRGIVWSKMVRKQTSVKRACKNWLVDMQIMLSVYSTTGRNGPFMQIRYEDLCKDTTGILRKILNPLGVAVTSADLFNLTEECHELGGSPRFSAEKNNSIVLDTRWRREMQKETLAIFEKIAGKINRRLGYE